ncbi:copper resistance protein CopC/CopD (plasmid) [Streptomyces sp. NBC_00637]|uniref:copper resistance CopC/CopD family protein n=1 Tax=Streptomyces sp. NBC_00637 TaxID=2903667 RepID=UPI002F912D68
MWGGWVRRSVRLVIALTLAAAGLLIGAPASQAHAVLLFASPAIEGAVPTAPKAVSLVFDEPVQAAGARTVRLTASAGTAVAVGAAARSQGGRQLTVPVRGTLGPGVYTVEWQATAQDGDVMGGSYRFAVGSAAAGLSAGAAGGQQQVSGAGVTAVLRWVLFAAFALVLGGLVGERLAARHGIRAPRSWARGGAVGALAASLGLTVLIAGGGSLVEGVSSPSASALFGGRAGLLAVIGTAAWLVAAVALWRGWRPVAWAGLAAALVAEGLRAHPASASSVWGPVLTTVHLAAAAVWIGALVHIVRIGVAHRWGAGFRAALGSYARLALVLVIVVLFSGTLSGLLLVSPSELWDTGFGKVLVVKLSLVVAVCALALAARWRMVRSAPRSLVRVEASALVAVLAVTAWLSVTQPPRDAQAALPFAPPATGNAITVGGRADQIGIAATASAGQVVLRLTAPTTDLERGDSRSYEASLRLADAAGRARTVALRGCGDGCFYAPVAWKKGANLLTVRTAAKGWGGGAETLRVMWPVRPDAALLKQTVKAMRAVGTFTLHEQVASDTARSSVAPTKLQVTGDQFVDSEPYAKGSAPLSSRFTDAEGNTVLALGFPGERLALELTLDEQDRVVRETLVAPNHFIRRSFTYPEPEGDHGDGHDHEHDADSDGR